MKTKKFLLIITALSCMLTMSACNKKQDGTDTDNVSRETTASKAAENSSETTVIDVFSELKVSFEGGNGEGKIICEYTGDNEFIKYDVKFKGEGDGGYTNGDTAVVKLDYSDYRAENANVFFKEKEKEYTVEGLCGVILNSDGYDFSECNKILEEQIFDKGRIDSKFKISDLDIGNTFWTAYVDGELENAFWEILSAEYEPIKGKFFIPEYSSKVSNDYFLFYKATILCERIDGDFNVNPNTKYAVGDTKEWTFLISEETHNVFVEKDSNIVKVNPEAYSITAYGGGMVDVMSMGKIYGMAYDDEYNNNFDEYFEKTIGFLMRGDFYDIEIE